MTAPERPACAALISYISTFTVLRPGDVVLTGIGLQHGHDEEAAVGRRQPRDVDLAEDADGAHLPILSGDGVVAQEEAVEVEARIGHRSSIGAGLRGSARRRAPRPTRTPRRSRTRAGARAPWPARRGADTRPPAASPSARSHTRSTRAARPRGRPCPA